MANKIEACQSKNNFITLRSFLKISYLAYLVLCSITSQAQAENLIFNSSFELGEKGWNTRRVINPDSEGYFQYPAKDACIITEDESKTGGQSAKLEAEQGKQVLISHDFLIETGKSYTVSFWIKAPQKSSIQVEVRSEQIELRKDQNGNILPDLNHKESSKTAPHTAAKLEFNVGTEWTRKHLTFTPSPLHTAYAVLFIKEGNAVYLDDVQVEEGLLHPYEPAAKIEAAIYTESILSDSSKLEGQIKAISYASDAKNFTIPLTLYDAYYDRTRGTQDISMNLEAGKSETASFEFNLQYYGMFCVFSGLQPRTTRREYSSSTQMPESSLYTKLKAGDKSYQSGAFFVSVPKAADIPEQGFKLGVNGALTMQRWSWQNLKWAADSQGNPYELAKIIRASGATIHRCWDPMLFNWKELEPEKGRFHWSDNDKQIELAEKAGLPLMVVLGGNFTLKRIPDWVASQDRTGHPEAQLFPGKNDKIVLPQLSDWRAYVSAIATRYKGRIPYYEILNEPNFSMTAEYYTEYLKAAYEEIKKADSHAFVIGLSTTADKGFNMQSFLAQCLSLGADKWMDFITIHPYCCTDTSIPSQMERRRNLLKYLQESKVKAKLWNGENYYLVPAWDWNKGDEHLLQNAFPPDAISRHYIVDMGEGLYGSTPCYFDSLLSSKTNPYQHSLSCWDGVGRRSPNERYAAHAAAASFLAGAKPYCNMELSERTQVYVFTNSDRLLSAIWNASSQVKLTCIIRIPENSKLKIYNLMGNKITESTSEISVPLSSEPYYLEWNSSDPEAVRASLSNAVFRKQNGDEAEWHADKKEYEKRNGLTELWKILF